MSVQHTHADIDSGREPDDDRDTIPGQPSERLDPLEQARQNPRSRVRAIAAKCFDCQGRDADPCWRWRIGNCEHQECPLYPLRPHQGTHGRPMPASLSP